MSQHDGVIDDSTGLTVRTDLNNALAAIRSGNSGAVAPTVTLAGLTWFDTSVSPGVLKIRNKANSAWIIVKRADEVKPNFNVFLSADQVMPYAVFTPMLFNNVVWDDGGYYNAGTRLYTPPAGRYLMTASIAILGSSGFPATGNMQIKIDKNGSTIGGLRVMYSKVANEYMTVRTVTIVSANGTDNFRVSLYNGGLPGGVTVANTGTDTFFAGKKI